MSSSKNHPNLYASLPPSGLQRMLWRWSTKFQAASAISMLQPWEKAVVGIIALIVTLLVWFSIYAYYPEHATYLSQRFSFYIFGDEHIGMGNFVYDGAKGQASRMFSRLKDIGAE
nr:hypothetical protein L204_02993 [Cryptococcus depauperatus CBS 7855]